MIKRRGVYPMNRARGINEITRRNAGKYDKRASQNVRNESRSLAIFKPFVPEIEPRNRVEILKSAVEIFF